MIFQLELAKAGADPEIFHKTLVEKAKVRKIQYSVTVMNIMIYCKIISLFRSKHFIYSVCTVKLSP